ncbi:MAG TPA: hypothetical protein VGI20_14310 [Rhizomicrobium sp.]|jgi:hypothetical protein
MADGQRHPRKIGRFFHRRVADIVIAVAALFVSAISLWIGVRTENANEELVAGSTWPFLQVQVSNATPDSKQDLQFMVVNAGVGPAKIESFEVYWKRKPYRSARKLLLDCCGFKDILATSPEANYHTRLTTGTVQGTVLRAGDTKTFIHYPLGSDNLAVWGALDHARVQMSYRICYCSVLNECWRNPLAGEQYNPAQLRPEAVKSCPVPPVAYTQ